MFLKIYERTVFNSLCRLNAQNNRIIYSLENGYYSILAVNYSQIKSKNVFCNRINRYR